MRASLKRFVFLKLFFDVICIASSFILAYVIKFKIPFITLYLWQQQYGTIHHHAQVEPYINSLWIIISIGILTLFSAKAYQPTVGILPGIDECIKVILGMSYLLGIVLFTQFFTNIIPESRMVILYFWLFSIVTISIIRLIVLRFERLFYKKGVGSKRSIIIGTTMLSQDIAERMIMYPGMGYQYIGFIGDNLPDKIHYHLREAFQVLGGIEDYQAVIQKYKIDSIFIIRQNFHQKKLAEILNFCEEHNIQFNVVSQPILGMPFIKAEVFDGIQLLSSTDRDSTPVQRIVKRCFDIVFSFCILLLLSPLYLAVAIWIKCVSPNGPVIYKQERVGQFGKLFMVYKFRSMIPDAEIAGPEMVNEHGENRYIKGGQRMRQFSLDEFPQFWNVLIGDMSVVGPRPERPFFVDQFSKDIPHFKYRHQVPAGITGWAQINGRSVLTRRPEHKIKYDLYYINHWSLILDLKILIKTLAVVFYREESY